MNTDQLLEDVVTLKLRGDAWRLLAKSLDNICLANEFDRKPSSDDIANVSVARKLLVDLGCDD